MERELLLLGLLRHNHMHGYELHEFINRDLASCTDLKKPTAYYLLDKMAAKGWITQTEEQEGSRPPRRVYQLTAEGEAAFQRLLRENLVAYHQARFAGDIGLAFVDALEPEEARTLLQRRRDTLAGELAATRHIPLHHGTLQLVIEHQIRHLKAELEWLDEVLGRLSVD
ncbi:MAG: helix-turn-helix transcriptional regulator [Anaerolineaceae bacterium]|nr:helix-turn-helix transcriptional regulator [Anaerolineaceae bacterium]